ncbi:MAG: hypothetical protein JO262_13975 [Solirubrobacterales bacterium]|nr:hypothetical protein [Solirubrobacterales bacterium]
MSAVGVPAARNSAETRIVEAVGIDASHGFLLQYPTKVAVEVNAFLARSTQ